MAKRTFLKADWNNLIMLNYEVDPAILQKYIPPGTELDLWQGKALVSMVGFMFCNTSVLGVKWPWHINFEEVNLRFYVRYFDGEQWKRGAVFISEIVPKPIIAFIANNLYKEHYRALPMRHSVTLNGDDADYSYQWKLKGRWNTISAKVSQLSKPIESGSAEEFIFEHYWGYNALNNTETMEYEVEHVSWEVSDVLSYLLDIDVAELYGKQFVPFLRKAHSAFFAKGSAIGVRMGTKIQTVPKLP